MPEIVWVTRGCLCGSVLSCQVPRGKELDKLLELWGKAHQGKRCGPCSEREAETIARRKSRLDKKRRKKAHPGQLDLFGAKGFLEKS